MIVKFQAPGRWLGRGMNIVRLLPRARVETAPAKYDLAVTVSPCRERLELVVADGAQQKRAIVPAAPHPYLCGLFNLLSSFIGAPLSPWGIFTGVRPGKVAARLLAQDSADLAADKLVKQYLLAPDKARLLVEAVANGQPLLAGRGVSLYVAVPFCPSRCHYCSFAAYPLDRWRHLLGEYLAAASSELAQLLAACKRRQIALNSIYVGGGTPTALTPGQLEQLLAPAKGAGCEFTVEAGRPDTVTPAHLEVLQRLGVTRISINCQYPAQETLAAIGRSHSVEQFDSALEMALASPLMVNSDLIIGLPGQTSGGFARALEQLMAAGVHNITVHALAIKRGAKTRSHYLDSEVALDISRRAYQVLATGSYRPYYLYRQKNIAANLENVGFGLPGTYCYYNVASISETEPVLGAGAGAASKLVSPDALATLTNPRDPNQYLARKAGLTQRKLDWLGQVCC